MTNREEQRLEKERIRQIVEECIEKLVEKFKEAPHTFYTESDIHCYLYQLIYKESHKIRRFECPTKNGQSTILLHKEYPPIAKKERRRGHFDLALLDPDHVHVLSRSKLRDGENNPSPPLIAIELALDYGTEHLIKDYEGLINSTNRVQHGYILHFIRDIDMKRHMKRREKRQTKFSELKKEINRIRDEGKVKIWYVEYSNGKIIDEIKSIDW